MDSAKILVVFPLTKLTGDNENAPDYIWGYKLPVKNRALISYCLSLILEWIAGLKFFVFIKFTLSCITARLWFGR